MALNPIAYTEKVVGNFLRYQLSAYPFAEPGLNGQMRALLNLDASRRTPLLKGPYISLSRPFAVGAALRDLAEEKLVHPGLPLLARHPGLWKHQEEALRAILSGRTTLVSTGTGSGKTEAFLYPIISRCLSLRDAKAPAGVVAVLVYPMNALAEDQLNRLRWLLAGTKVTYGLYVGSTPETEAEVTGRRLATGASRADYEQAEAQAARDGQTLAIHPPEEACSRQAMRQDPPRILLSNVKQLELLLTRHKDVELFNGALLDYLVFDEAHTCGGAIGAETACLIRRLEAHCGQTPGTVVGIATSATLADPHDEPDAAQAFASRFFGVAKDDVTVVREAYEDAAWPREREVPQPLPDPNAALTEVLSSVDDGAAAGQRISHLARQLWGWEIAPDEWQGDLYDRMHHNELVYQLERYLREPKELVEVLDDLRRAVKRDVPEEELLLWLTLGAAARDGSRPFLRPVVHAFVRGMGGAVVTFPLEGPSPQLHLDAGSADEAKGGEFHRLPVLTCNTCGQHYFEHHLQDFRFTGAQPEGGDATEDGRIWRPLAPTEAGASRVVLFDRLVEDDADDPLAGPQPSGTARVWMCRYCGALRPDKVDVCAACAAAAEPWVPLLAVKWSDQRPGYVSSCSSCRSPGGQRFGSPREPMRPVRAVAVADVHVLAQEMIRHSERERLLVFCDNRQDAAFQAGWMRDHARRYRLRALMWEQLQAAGDAGLLVSDLAGNFDDVFDADEQLSRSLLREVWEAESGGAQSDRHRKDRRHYLHIQVLRELTTGAKQRIGLEPWGRLLVLCPRLKPDQPFFQTWAKELGIEPEALVQGVNGLLDLFRRGAYVWDRHTRLYSRYWRDGDRDVQRGYLPLVPGGPKGLKLRRETTDDAARVTAWLPTSGQSRVTQMVANWFNAAGLPDDPQRRVRFVEDLWNHLLGVKVLTPATLTGGRDKPLPGTSGVVQIDAEQLRLAPHRGTHTCAKCRRSYPRSMPFDLCPTWRCGGQLEPRDEDGDSYDLGLLEAGQAMLRAAEHSAQVPHSERERLEREFRAEDSAKGSDSVNTLVCTPTLELGVDIGGLDGVLMRNVPPLASNYLQRVGRAGRRFRMAVNLTYARSASHDQFYFQDPLKLLGGRVEPPRFNLSNEVLVRKHVHAAVLGVLHRLADSVGEVPDDERQAIAEVLAQVFPQRIASYLFEEDGAVRREVFSVSPLACLIEQHGHRLLPALEEVFQPGWPVDAQDVVQSELLGQMLAEMPDELRAVLRRLKQRLDWAHDQAKRLEERRAARGRFDEFEEAQWHRCHRLIRRLAGEERRRAAEGEGHDDSNTFSVLAAEGFLPGYGLEVGAIRATAVAPTNMPNVQDLVLSRAPGVALRDFVPGNMVYANGHRYVPRFLHLLPEAPTEYFVDIAAEAVTAAGGSASATTDGAPAAAASLTTTSLLVSPLPEVDLAHTSHISDEEEYRFQLPVATYGYEEGRHSGGVAYTWGDRAVHWRRGVHLLLVNVGPQRMVAGGNAQLGYPVCRVCGQSRSPFASAVELGKFREDHLERCKWDGRPLGFSARVVADCLSLQDCQDRTQAVSVLESLLVGATRVLDMERDDLHTQIIDRTGTDRVDGLLYDPVPGGSGLLQQIVERFDEVVVAALDAAGNCPGACERVCVDCLATFRNAYHHRYLDRHRAAADISTWGPSLDYSHDLPPHQPSSPQSATTGGLTVNQAEDRLRDLLASAGMPSAEWQRPIPLDGLYDRTVVDAYYELGEDDPGVCVYLDGLSEHIHGNDRTQDKDRAIRAELRSKGYEVIEIAATELWDRERMRLVFYRLGRILCGLGRARELRDDPSWFA